MCKVEVDMHPDNRLHLPNAPLGSLRVMNKIAKHKIKHAKLPQGTRMGDATLSVIRTHMKKGA